MPYKGRNFNTHTKIVYVLFVWLVDISFRQKYFCILPNFGDFVLEYVAPQNFYVAISLMFGPKTGYFDWPRRHWKCARKIKLHDIKIIFTIVDKNTAVFYDNRILLPIVSIVWSELGLKPRYVALHVTENGIFFKTSPPPLSYEIPFQL